MNIMPDFKAIILAAGAGTRMKSSLPKVLHKLSGKPMITLVMDSIVNAGVQDIIAVIPSCKEPFKETLEEKITIAVQKHPKEADTLYCNVDRRHPTLRISLS